MDAEVARRPPGSVPVRPHPHNSKSGGVVIVTLGWSLIKASCQETAIDANRLAGDVTGRGRR